VAKADFKDYYSILGLSKTASADEIKKAFRQLARKYHPDVNPSDKAAEERFKEISEAYEVLSDTDKRQKYDQFGQYWKQAGSGGGGNPFGGGGNPFGGGNAGFDDVEFGRYGNFEEFINELLGRNGGARSTSTSNPFGGANTSYRTSTSYSSGPGSSTSSSAGPNLDTEANITLTFAEVFNGVEKKLTIGTTNLDVKIPPGAKRIRLRGKGKTSPFYTSERGDLYLNVELKPHAFFQLDGNNLTCEMPIAPDEAALGNALEVPTPDGTVTLNVPAGIRSGQSLRLKGKGWKDAKGNRGDLMVKVQITVPKEISAPEREAYEQLRAKRESDPRSHLKGIQL
jgi:curved DNA-binding protein